MFTALDLLTESILLALPLSMIWHLQMPTRKRLVVLGAFWLRSPLLALSVGRFIYTRRLCRKGVDLGLDSALLLIWLLVESTYALLVSQFLALRAFTLSFNSGFGFGFTVNAGPESYSLQQRSGNKAASKPGSGAFVATESDCQTATRNWQDDRPTRGMTTLNIVRETEYSVEYLSSTDEIPILRETRQDGLDR